MSPTTSRQSPLVCRGVKEISEIAGINPKRFKHYVDKLGLPVFKVDAESNIWLATHDDLVRWIEKRKEVYLQENQS